MQLRRRKASPAPEAADAELVSEERLLIVRAQQSPAAFAPLYVRYRDDIARYCFFRLSSHADAEDAASAVFAKALGNIGSFEGRGGSFRSWLFSIAHNEVVDRLRARPRQHDAPLESVAERPSGARSPEELAIDADTWARLADRIAALPKREREVLELRAAGLDTTEIARTLEITPGNVRSIQSRALARLLKRAWRARFRRRGRSHWLSTTSTTANSIGSGTT